jgi:glycopeptide antibiotics resistance protein
MILRHPLLGTATALYLGLVAWITLSPEPYDSRIDGFLFRALGVLHRHDGTAWITYASVEGAANVAMFVPVGVFLPTRVSDVRDLVHNGLGALIGVVVVLILTARSENARRRAQRLRPRSTATGPRPLVGSGR